MKCCCVTNAVITVPAVGGGPATPDELAPLTSPDVGDQSGAPRSVFSGPSVRPVSNSLRPEVPVAAAASPADAAAMMALAVRTLPENAMRNPGASLPVAPERVTASALADDEMATYDRDRSGSITDSDGWSADRRQWIDNLQAGTGSEQVSTGQLAKFISRFDAGDPGLDVRELQAYLGATEA